MDKKRIVVKTGSHLLTKDNGQLDSVRIATLVEQFSKLYKSGVELILVTSGAIVTGTAKLKLKHKPKTLPEKQSAAAVGQPLLMHVYETSFARYSILTAQLLLTRDDFENRTRYLNTKNTVFTLLKFGVVPIINENDTVSVEEIQFGDNDTLSALVSVIVEADMLIILTDVEGLCTSDPNIDKNACCIHEIKQIDEKIEKIARRSCGSFAGTGGMYSKVQAAKITTKAGIETVIADGRKSDILDDILSCKKVGTRFIPSKKIVISRKKWK